MMETAGTNPEHEMLDDPELRELRILMEHELLQPIRDIPGNVCVMEDFHTDSCCDNPDKQFLQELEAQMELEVLGPSRGCANTAGLIYRPLLNRRSIRVLILCSGVGKNPLYGYLRHVELDRYQDYEALSYAWGSAVKQYTMTIDTHKVPITQSLHGALLRLRYANSSRCLWADALCINQADANEKSSQVSIMSDIFSFARRVVCWLGEDSYGDGRATFELMRQMANTHFKGEFNELLTDSAMQLRRLPEQGNPQWFAACRFFQRPWFTRAWVIQEFVLGRSVDMVCGERELPWHIMGIGLDHPSAQLLFLWGTYHTLPKTETLLLQNGLYAMQFMLSLKNGRTKSESFLNSVRRAVRDDQHHLSRFQNVLQSKWALTSPRMAEELQKNSVCDKMATTLHRCMGSALGSDVRDALFLNDIVRSAEAMKNETSQVSKPPLCDIMQMASWITSSDGRDRFFALLSLSGQRDNPSLQPDYSEPVESTYIRFAKHFLIDPNDMDRVEYVAALDLLIFAGTAHRVTSLDLPSWVAELPASPSHRGRIIGGQRYLHYNAAGSTKHKCRATGHERTVFVAGGEVDVITRIVRQPCEPSGTVDVPKFLRESDEFFKSMDELVVQRETMHPHLAGEEAHRNVAWRTLIGNIDDNFSVASDEFHKSYLVARHCFTKLQARARWAASQGRRFDFNQELPDQGWYSMWQDLASVNSVCETRGGRLGLVPNGSVVGDAVCLFLGESLPFVIRPLDGNWAKHQIIGPCYIHGIMQGEAMASDHWHEEEFCLV